MAVTTATPLPSSPPQPTPPPPPSLSSSSPLHPHRNHHTDTTTPSRHPQGCVWALSRTTRMRMVWVVLGTKGACGVQEVDINKKTENQAKMTKLSMECLYGL
ncbi:hypothetical protein Tco_0911424 [Tanacetum coccineum]|uniref:Uncharacterized protein n=1 Tax=Tanacetum coccineum TaxID=301880 RepID=A0ABQ5D2V8_9ASTR